MRAPLILGVLAAAALAGAALATPVPNPAGPVTTAPSTSPPMTTAPADPQDTLHAPRGVADCIWGEVPQDVRDTIASAGSIDVIATAIKKLGADRADEVALADHCAVPSTVSDPAAVVQHAIEARTLQIWTTGQLKTAYGVSDERLAVAWAKVTPDQKAAFAHWFGDGLQSPDGKIDQVQGLMDGLGLTGDDAAAVVLFYAGSRSLYEQLGGTV